MLKDTQKMGDEKFLLQRLKDDDIKALEVIFNRHYSNLCKYLLLIFKSQLLVDHVAQDIFIHLWENRKKIEIKTSLESYLYSAGRYKAVNEFRNAKRHEKIEASISETLEKESESPFSILESKELEQIINEAINKLPERCQQIFRLSREEELSNKEIAQTLNISINTVETQITIASKKIRNNLRPFYLQIFSLFL